MPRHPRVQVQGPERIPLQPQARPVNVPVVRRRADINLGNLAGALAPFAQGLGRIAGILQKKRISSETEEGAQKIRDLLATKNNAQALARLIKEGKIFAQESPFFVFGAKQQLGRVAGDQYNAAIKTAFARSPLVNSEDPEAFEQFLAEERTKFLTPFGEDRDPSFNNAFNRVVDGHNANLRNNFAARASRNITATVIAMTALEASGIMQAVGENAITQEEGATKLDRLLEMQALVGLPRKEGNDAVIDGVMLKARDLGDTSIMEVLKGVETIPGHNLYEVAVADGRVQATIDTISTDTARDWRLREAIEASGKRKARDNVFIEAGELLDANPRADLSALQTRLLANGGSSVNFGAWRDAYVASTTGAPSNARLRRELLLKVHGFGDPGEHFDQESLAQYLQGDNPALSLGDYMFLREQYQKSTAQSPGTRRTLESWAARIRRRYVGESEVWDAIRQDKADTAVSMLLTDASEAFDDELAGKSTGVMEAWYLDAADRILAINPRGIAALPTRNFILDQEWGRFLKRTEYNELVSRIIAGGGVLTDAASVKQIEKFGMQSWSDVLRAMNLHIYIKDEEEETLTGGKPSQEIIGIP